jgi:hypothetical protein
MKGPLTRIVEQCLRDLAEELETTGETTEARDDIYAAAKALAKASRALHRIISPLRPLRTLVFGP